MTNTIKSKKLQKGDVVGIVSLSGPILEWGIMWRIIFFQLVRKLKWMRVERR